MKERRNIGFRLDQCTVSFEFSGCPLGGDLSFDDRVRFYAGQSRSEGPGREKHSSGRGLDLALNVFQVDG